MKKILSIVGICTLIFVLYTVHYYNRSIKYQAFTGMVTLKIVDYDGNIVSNANVEICFANALNNNRCVRKGKTDANGFFIAKGVSDGDIIYKITKDGYYRTKDRYWFSRGGTERSKWFPWILKFTPWNPTLNVVLKEIRNPISMYYKSIRSEVPVLNQYVGFDLRQGDWVTPYGNGTESNITFYVSGYFSDHNNRESKMNVFFNDKETGIKQETMARGTKFTVLYNAPINGYSTNYFFRKYLSLSRKEKENASPRENIYFIYKIKCGNINDLTTNFIYGVIFSDFRCDYNTKTTISISFNYFYNPILNNRNLEWNGSNLFDSVESE